MRIAIAGSGRLGCALMEPLLDSHHEVVALLQNGRTSRGWKRVALRTWARALGAASGVMGLAARHGLPIIWLDRLNDAELAPLRALQPDVVLVGGFGIIFKRPLLDLPRIGCVNTHSSLLPKHRGPNPFSAVLFAGETETGVTFHVMDEGIDTGDILEQHALPIMPQDTALSVYNRACDVAAKYVLGVMDRVEREGLHGTPQDPEQASYDKNLELPDRAIRWEDSAREVERRVRALRPFYVARFQFRGRTVFVTQIRYDDAPVDAAPGTIVQTRPHVRIATGRGSVSVLVAFTGRPVPWLWPAPWDRLECGEKVS